MCAMDRMQETVRQHLLRFGNERLELEWRLGCSVNGHFVAGVGQTAFEKLRASLDKSGAAHIKDTYVAEHIPKAAKNGERFVVSPPDAPTGHWRWKTRVCVEDRQGARACLAMEEQAVQTIPFPVDSVFTSKRVKARRSYQFGAWSVDLTLVTGSVDEEATYEVEVELVDKDEMFVRPLDNILAWGWNIASDMIKIMSVN